MALPSLATVDDIAARAPDLQLDDTTQAEALLSDASALVRSYAGCTWVDDEGNLADVPEGLPGIVAMIVIRALRIPEGVTQETIGNYSVSYAPNATDRLYLSRADKAFLRRISGRGGAYSISTYGPVGYLGIAEDVDWTQ